jgi:hypothetical protein
MGVLDIVWVVIRIVALIIAVINVFLSILDKDYVTPYYIVSLLWTSVVLSLFRSIVDTLGG